MISGHLSDQPMKNRTVRAKEKTTRIVIWTDQETKKRFLILKHVFGCTDNDCALKKLIDEYLTYHTVKLE